MSDHNPDLLLNAATELLNQLVLLTRDDESYLWRIGGRPLDDAYKALKRAVAAEADPHAEIVRLKAIETQHLASLSDVMRAGDMEHSRMAAILEACEVFAAFVESYGPDSALARDSPTFYGVFRVYGKNARAAVSAVRPQADALLAEMDAARAVVEAARVACEASLFDQRGPLVTAIARYDWTVQKAKSE